MSAIKYLMIAMPLAAHALIEFRFAAFSLIPIYWSVLFALGIFIGLSLAVTALQATVLTGGLFAVLLLVKDFQFAIYIPSVLVPVLVASGFAFSLLPGRTPLITRLALLEISQFSARIAAYTRVLTWVWAIFLLAIAAEAFALATWGTVELWSLFANLLNYVFIFAFVVLEYAARTRVLREIEFPPFLQFLRSLPALGSHRQGG